MRSKKRSGPNYTANQAISYNNEISAKALRIQIELLKANPPQNANQLVEYNKRIRKLENLLPENSHRQKTLVGKERRKLIGIYMQYGKLTHTEVLKIAAKKQIPLQYVAYSDPYLTNSNTCYYLQNFWLYTPGQCREIYSQVKRIANNEAGLNGSHPYEILPTLEQNTRTYPNTLQPKPLVEADLESPLNPNNNNNNNNNNNLENVDNDGDNDDYDSDDEDFNDNQPRRHDPNSPPHFYNIGIVPESPMTCSPTPPNMDPADPPNPPNDNDNNNPQLPAYFSNLKMVTSPSEVRALKREERSCIVKFEDGSIDLGATLANYNRLIDTYRYTEINRMRGLHDILLEESEDLSVHLKYLKTYEDYLNTLISLDTVFCAKDRAKENLKKFRRRMNEPYAFSFNQAVKLFKNSRNTPRASYDVGPKNPKFCFGLYEFALKALVALAHPDLVDDANDAINDKKMRGDIVDIDELVAYLQEQETWNHLKLPDNRFLHDVEIISINHANTEVSNNLVSLNDEDDENDDSPHFNSRSRLRRHKHQSPSIRQSRPPSVVRFNSVHRESSNYDSDDDSSDHYPQASSPMSSPLGRMLYESPPSTSRQSLPSSPYNTPPKSPPLRDNVFKPPTTHPNNIERSPEVHNTRRMSSRLKAQRNSGFDQDYSNSNKDAININNYTFLSENIEDLKKRMSQYLISPPSMPSRAVNYIDKRPTQSYIDELKETLTTNEALYIMSILARSIMNIDSKNDKLSLQSHQAIELIIKEITAYSPPCQILLAFLSHDACHELSFLYDALYGATQTKASFTGKSMIFEYILIHSNVQVNFTRFQDNRANSYNHRREHDISPYRRDYKNRYNSTSNRRSNDRYYDSNSRDRQRPYRPRSSSRYERDHRDRRTSRSESIENYNVGVRSDHPNDNHSDRPPLKSRYDDRNRIYSNRDNYQDRQSSRYRESSQNRPYTNQSEYTRINRHDGYDSYRDNPSLDRSYSRERRPADHSLERIYVDNKSRDNKPSYRSRYNEDRNRNRTNSQDNYNDRRTSYRRSDSPYNSPYSSDNDRNRSNYRNRDQTPSKYQEYNSLSRNRTPSNDRQSRPDRDYRNNQSYRREPSQDRRQPRFKFLGDVMKLDTKFPDARQRKCNPPFNCTGRCDTFSNCLKCRSLNHVTCQCPYFEKLGDCPKCKPDYRHTSDECPRSQNDNGDKVLIFPTPTQ